MGLGIIKEILTMKQREVVKIFLPYIFLSLHFRRTSPKSPSVAEKNFGRMICRQNHFKSFCQKIILPENFQNFILTLIL